MTDYTKTIDQELDRLHKLVEQGKEVAWATKEISRILSVMISPAVMISDLKEWEKHNAFR
jgi:hypothetical protein